MSMYTSSCWNSTHLHKISLYVNSSFRRIYPPIRAHVVKKIFPIVIKAISEGSQNSSCVNDLRIAKGRAKFSTIQRLNYTYVSPSISFFISCGSIFESIFSFSFSECSFSKVTV